MVSWESAPWAFAKLAHRLRIEICSYRYASRHWWGMRVKTCARERPDVPICSFVGRALVAEPTWVDAEKGGLARI